MGNKILNKTRNKKFKLDDKLIDEKAKEYKERLLSGESIKDIQKDTDRVKKFEVECLELIKEFWVGQVEFYETYSKRGGRNSIIEKLFIMAFETHSTTGDIIDEKIKLKYEPEIICKSGKKYYPDFCFCYVVDNGARYQHLNLLIELDGHIFHEKTPEKVEQDKIRERELISNGYTILRFSGREVYRNPFKVITECIQEYLERVIKEWNS